MTLGVICFVFEDDCNVRKIQMNKRKFSREEVKKVIQSGNYRKSTLKLIAKLLPAVKNLS